MKEKMESEMYCKEREDFLSDKCVSCMSYLDKETGNCSNNFCESKWKY